MPTEIRCNHPEIAAESVGNDIPAAGMVSASVNEYQIGFIVDSPIPKMKFQAMGVIVLGNGFHG
jgi:hypothetical protein